MLVHMFGKNWWSCTRIICTCCSFIIQKPPCVKPITSVTYPGIRRCIHISPGRCGISCERCASTVTDDRVSRGRCKCISKFRDMWYYSNQWAWLVFQWSDLCIYVCFLYSVAHFLMQCFQYLTYCFSILNKIFCSMNVPNYILWILP
jgi:hypothetical protein